MKRPPAPVPTLLLAILAGAAAAAPQAVEEQEGAAPDEVVLGRSSAVLFEQPEAEETIEVRRGARLRLTPALSSPLLEMVAETATLPVVDRHEGWVRVRYGVWKGWVLVDGVDSGPLLSAAPPEASADPVRLDRARALLGEGARESTLGPYTLLTDLPDDRLLGPLGRVVSALDAAYRERFGVDPGPPGDETIVLFARERDYREFEREDLQLAGLDTLGHTTQALLTRPGTAAEPVIATLTATFAGRRAPDLLQEILVHELTHMLNRRALGPVVPPWLEEGLAEDLAFSRVDGEGRPLPGSWGGATDIRNYQWPGGHHRVELVLTGSRAALEALLRGWRTPYRPELELLTELSWSMLMDPASRPLLYAQSAFLVRYLLDGDDARSAESFRAYLRAVAAGQAAGGLWGLLDKQPAALEEGLYLWMRRQAGAHGIPLPGR